MPKFKVLKNFIHGGVINKAGEEINITTRSIAERFAEEGFIGPPDDPVLPPDKQQQQQQRPQTPAGQPAVPQPQGTQPPQGDGK